MGVMRVMYVLARLVRPADRCQMAIVVGRSRSIHAPTSAHIHLTRHRVGIRHGGGTEIPRPAGLAQAVRIVDLLLRAPARPLYYPDGSAVVGKYVRQTRYSHTYDMYLLGRLRSREDRLGPGTGVADEGPGVGDL